MAELHDSDLPNVARAMAIIDAVHVEPRVEEVALQEAQGRRLAEQVAADRDYPPFDKALMDGYAVRCADVAATPVELTLIGEIAAGRAAEGTLGAGEAMAIMTGAPMPDGADGVVPVEETAGVAGKESPLTPALYPGVPGEREKVRILSSTTPGRYIARRGSDVRAGEAVLPPGIVLESAQLAVAASVGAGRVKVFARPRVAVLSTGDELVPIDRQPGASQIRNSNNIMLLALLRKWGCEVTDLGTVVDRPEAIRAAIVEGMKQDALFVTGGMSMGAYDYVPRILGELGVELRITKVKIKPGKPFVFGISASQSAESKVLSAEEFNSALSTQHSALRDSCFVFGLPGNPVSGFVCALRFASRLIARLGGGEGRERWLSGRVDAGLLANGPREFYQPAIWKPAGGGTSARNEFAVVTPLAWKGSADLYTLAAANALLVRAENEPPVPKGTLVRVLEI